GRFVLAIQITAQLQSAVTLRAVHEDRDSAKDVLQRQLAAGEDRARRERELRFATLAFEDATRGVFVDRRASTLRAIGLAFVIGPADAFENVEGLMVRKAQHG